MMIGVCMRGKCVDEVSSMSVFTPVCVSVSLIPVCILCNYRVKCIAS